MLVEDQTACFGVRALSFASHKFARPRPEGEVVLRAFFRPTAEELGAPDATFVDRAASAARELLGTKGAPQRAWVSRWPEALTVYDERTRELDERADQALAPLGVYLAGSHYHGAGIDRAVASAERAAARALGLGDG